MFEAHRGTAEQERERESRKEMKRMQILPGIEICMYGMVNGCRAKSE